MKQKLTESVVKAAAPQAKPFEIADNELSGFTLRVEPGGAKTFFFRYRCKTGRQTRVKIGRSIDIKATQARHEVEQLRVQIRQGLDPQEEKRAARAHTLRSFLDGPYAERAHHKTAAAQVARVKACFPNLLDKSMMDILPMRIEGWRAKRLKEGKKPGAISRDEDNLIGVLSAAARWGVIPANPLRGMRRLKLDRAGKPRYLSPAEEAALMAAVDGREEELRAARDRFNAWRHERGYEEFPNLRECPFADHVKPMILISMNTGLRRGELFGLRWADLELEGPSPLITVRGEIAKSGRTRHVPMNAMARKTFAAWLTMAPKGEHVFTSKVTGGQFDHVNTAWRAILKAAGLQGLFRWHDMRHHFASQLVQRGVDLNTVRELLGHADLKMTLRYAHLAPKNTAAAVALLDRPDNVVQFNHAVGAPSK